MHAQLLETRQGVNTTSQCYSQTYPHFNLGVPNFPFVCKYHSVKSKVPVLSTVLCVSVQCTVCPNAVHFVSQCNQNPKPELVPSFPSPLLHHVFYIDFKHQLLSHLLREAITAYLWTLSSRGGGGGGGGYGPFGVIFVCVWKLLLSYYIWC